MFAIIISEKGGAERKESYDKNEINVGRVQGNDLMLPKGNVSKHHARLLYRDGRFIVTDLKSTNGTYVNGRKIAQATIVREGDKIYIGDFVLRLDGGSAPSEPASDSANEDASRTLDRGQRFGTPVAVPGAGPPQPSPVGPSSPAVATPPPGAVNYPLDRDPDESQSGSAASPPAMAMPEPPRPAAPVPQAAPTPASPVMQPAAVPRATAMRLPPGMPALPQQPPAAGPAPTGAPMRGGMTMPLQQGAQIPPAPAMARGPSAPAPVQQPPPAAPTPQPGGQSFPQQPPQQFQQPPPQPGYAQQQPPPNAFQPQQPPGNAYQQQPPPQQGFPQPPAPLQQAARTGGSMPPPGGPAKQMPRETPAQAARRLALITLVDRVAEAVDLSPLKASPLVDEQLSHIIDRTVRDQVKVMKDEGEAPEGADVEMLVRDAMRELVGLGPIGPLLEDDEVSEIHCLRHDQVLTVRAGGTTLADASFTSEAALGRTVARLAHQTGEPWRPGEFVLERRLARGAMMLAVAPPASSGYVLIIRKRRRADMSLEDYVRAGALSRAMATFVESCLAARANILVCGPPGSGTPSLLGALASAGPQGDRIAVVHELDEINVSSAHVVSLALADFRQRGEESVRAATKMRPDRLLVGSLAGWVGAATLESVADGTEGVLAGVQAPSLRQGLSKLVAQVVLARPGLNIESARELVGEAFDIAIELGRLPDGRPRVVRLAELGGSDGKGVVVRDVFTFVTENASGGDGTFAVSGVVPRVVAEFSARGVKVDPNIFKRAGRA